MRSLSELPPFSGIVNKLLASMADESVSLATLADLIEKDPVLAGNILSMVNSALYARRSTVNSVRHAMSLLGIRKIRNAALGMSIAGMWSQATFPRGWSMKAFNLHSAATAVLADMIAVEAPSEYPEGAFTAGLLHDLGRLLVATGLGEEFAAIRVKHVESGATLEECELAVLGFHPAELSERALSLWKLPPAIVTAVGSYPHLQVTPSATVAEIPLGLVIAAAERLVESLGISVHDSPPLPEPDVEAVVKLGLAAPRVAKLLAAFQIEYAAISPLFQ